MVLLERCCKSSCLAVHSQNLIIFQTVASFSSCTLLHSRHSIPLTKTLLLMASLHRPNRGGLQPWHRELRAAQPAGAATVPLQTDGGAHHLPHLHRQPHQAGLPVRTCLLHRLQRRAQDLPHLQADHPGTDPAVRLSSRLSFWVWMSSERLQEGLQRRPSLCPQSLASAALRCQWCNIRSTFLKAAAVDRPESNVTFYFISISSSAGTLLLILIPAGGLTLSWGIA